MNKDDYRTAMMSVMTAARMLAQWDFPKILESIERADAVGCFIDPTLYAKKAPAMREDREMFRAALPLWKLGKRLQELPLRVKGKGEGPPGG